MAVVVVAVVAVVVVAKARFAVKALRRNCCTICTTKFILRIAVRTNLVEFFARIANFIPFYLF